MHRAATMHRAAASHFRALKCGKIYTLNYVEYVELTQKLHHMNSQLSPAFLELSTSTIYNDTKIQLLDLPGIIEGASEGKGPGRQVIAVFKLSNLVLMVLDASKSEGHKQILAKELEAVGLRLNKKPPQDKEHLIKRSGVRLQAETT